MAIATDLWCSSECTPPCQGGGRGFKSRQVRHRAPTRLRAVGVRLPGRVAQLVERAPEKREVTGSTPVPTTGEVLARASPLMVAAPAGQDLTSHKCEVMRVRKHRPYRR
jgi:hypothetical protein